MKEETKALLEILSPAVDEFKFKLQCIDKLLGAPYAKDFPEATLSAITDDVLRYNMMLNDIYTFAARHVSNEIHDRFFEHVAERINAMQNKESK
jgi:hypothetical protein